MPDTISKKRRSENMSRIRSKDMKPEMLIRKLSHRLGYRHRLHRKDLPGKPDLVYSGRKKVIFVHGCFWHQHDDTNCKISRRPKSNLEYWGPKLDRNVARDASNQAELQRMGWDYIIIWECEAREAMRSAQDDLETKMRKFLQ
jgi:DNA mismatch endonuclease (patch repair protein)